MSGQLCRRGKLTIGSLLIATILLPAASALGQTYKALPPSGIEIDADTLTQLESRAGQLEAKLRRAAETFDDDATWRPDVEVLIRAVRLAIRQNLILQEIGGGGSGEVVG